MAQVSPPTLAPVDDGSGIVMEEQDAAVQHVITEEEVGEYKEQDRYLPIANVSRIMKSSVPDSAKIAKDAKECVQECVSEFISFITSEAAEKCTLEKRKTIGGEDVLYAMTSLGFENYAETLKIYLAKLRAQGGSSGVVDEADGGVSGVPAAGRKPPRKKVKLAKPN
ncbi:hypothetical protein FRB99_003998 [Tulasnella sp. 403]|nr:hypothetical protein FRB99_003998 [Tulasnella sp. 403]